MPPAGLSKPHTQSSKSSLYSDFIITSTSWPSHHVCPKIVTGLFNTHAGHPGSCKLPYSFTEVGSDTPPLPISRTGLDIVNIENSTINRRASAIVPASPRQGDQQLSQFSNNSSTSYSQHPLAPTSLQIRTVIPTTLQTQQTSDSTAYQYPQTTGTQELAYHPSPGFTYSANTPNISQT